MKTFNKEKLNALAKDDGGKWLHMARHRRRYSWYYYIKDRIHIKYLRLKRRIKNARI